MEEERTTHAPQQENKPKWVRDINMKPQTIQGSFSQNYIEITEKRTSITGKKGKILFDSNFQMPKNPNSFTIIILNTKKN